MNSANQGKANAGAGAGRLDLFQKLEIKDSTNFVFRVDDVISRSRASLEIKFPARERQLTQADRV